MKGQTGENLLFLLESRLDNLVYRLGIAPTRAAARQLVLHRHITLDGAICNVPSCLVKPGQTIAVRERSKSLEVIQNSVASATKYSWLDPPPSIPGWSSTPRPSWASTSTSRPAPRFRRTSTSS